MHVNPLTGRLKQCSSIMQQYSDWYTAVAVAVLDSEPNCIQNPDHWGKKCREVLVAPPSRFQSSDRGARFVAPAAAYRR